MAKLSAKYEVIYVVDPAVGEEGIAALVEKFNGIVALAEKYKLALFSDEIYDKILYDGVEHISLREEHFGFKIRTVGNYGVSPNISDTATQ